MATNKQARLSEDIKKELIDVIKALKDPRLEGGLLTVMHVDVTPDLDVAKVYISVIGKENGTVEAVEALTHATGHIRTEISKRMHIRKAPAFRFVEDAGAAHAARINEILGELKSE